MKLSFSIVLTAIFIIASSAGTFAQNKGGGVIEKGTNEYKLFMAKQSFFAGDYRTAINKYKEVLMSQPGDASVQFYIGQCYFMTHDYSAALQFLEAAQKVNPSVNDELSLYLGRTYHYKSMLDKALDELNKYRKSIADNSKKIEETQIDVYIAQCKVAKQLMANPVNVTITPLIDINSHYDDKGPVLTNNDKTMIFTSRRPAGDKSKLDKEGDYGYFDDIYESTWNDETQTWSQADMIRGPLNSDGYDACTSISSDGMFMFIYRNDPAAARGGEIFMSKRSTSGKWRTPAILLKPINTSYYEDAACLSPDGNKLYFVSERPGGLGKGDIWVSQKIGSHDWGEPVNIGAPVNTSFDENGLSISSDGKTLFFCSNGPTSMGSYDIFRTTMGSNGKWSTPVNIGYPINSVNIESKFVMTADKKTAYISTVRDSGLGERDIMQVNISGYNVLTGETIAPPPPPVILKTSLSGKVVDTAGVGIVAEIKLLDKITGAEVAKTNSAQDGSFSIDLKGDTDFTLEVVVDGFQKVSESVQVPSGQTQSKNITLIKNN